MTKTKKKRPGPMVMRLTKADRKVYRALRKHYQTKGPTRTLRAAMYTALTAIASAKSVEQTVDGVGN